MKPMTNLPKHPGTLTIKDNRSGRVLRTLDASALPKAFCYFLLPSGWAPITTIFQTEGPTGVSWAYYTQDGTFVRSGSGWAS